ncbi:transporter substrate-binding domain-containing protein [Vibrio sp. Isolate34]|uniref:ATP-binding protein n=1 Tax=Vibrio sp. Isolate34 TaxID=2908540 RepID=UPI001EFD03E6|nr:transporter substrate-binding domain-containing protein [Vibrio sp. Isolate34]MCG9641074.1 transporter substrate-binding domain-containing protein [Vibrio sp. Isolate34]
MRSLILLASLIVVSFSSYSQAENLSLSAQERGFIAEHRVITVGLLSHERAPYATSYESGTSFGINNDYMQNIAQILGFELEYQPYPSVDSLLDAVETGSVDIALGVRYTDERSNVFLFSEPFYNGSAATWYRNKKAQFISPKLLSWSCVEGSVYCGILEEKKIPNIFSVQHFDQAIALVNSGVVDAIAGNFVSINSYLNDHDVIRGAVKIPDWLETDALHAIGNQNQTQLLALIDRVLQKERKGLNQPSIRSLNPYHLSEQLARAYKQARKSDADIEYSMQFDLYPLSFKNSKNEVDGYFHDFMELLQARSGLQFSLKQSDHYTTWQMLERGDIDVAPVVQGIGIDNEKYITSEPFFTQVYWPVIKNPGIIARIFEPTKRDQKAGVLTNSSSKKFSYIKMVVKGEVVPYDDVQDLLEDLANNKIEIAYIPQDMTQSLVIQDKSDEFLLDPDYAIELDLVFAMKKNNLLLQALINSVLNTIDNNEVEKLKHGYRQFKVVNGFDKHDVYIIAGGLSSFIFFMGTLIYFAITNLKLKMRVTQQLAESAESKKEWLKSIVEELPSTIFIQDEQNEIAHTNCKSYLANECSGCSLLSQKNNDNHAVCTSQKVIESSAPVTDSCQAKNCLIGIEQFERTRKKLSSPASGKGYVLSILNDVTEQKQYEEQLIEATKASELATKMREQFLATMSHELRTPIAALSSSLEMIERHNQDAGIALITPLAQQSCVHLNRLVDEILDFSKLNANELSIEPTELDFLQLVNETTKPFESRALEKDLQFAVDITQNGSGIIMIDGVRFTQIVNNLLSNAIKFTQVGSINVHSYISNNTLYFMVKDTGIGMSTSQLNDAFKPFTQADNSIERSYGGTGLGLSIVDQLVKNMGGKIMVESALNQGTSIEVTLPITVVTKSQSNKNLSVKQDAATIAQQEFAALNLQVLVAEDNAINRHLMQMQLKDMGISPVVCVNGQEAYALLTQPENSFDALITDCHMPILNGYELAFIIRSNEKLADLFVIGCTAEDPRLTEKKNGQNSFDILLHKPYGIEDLYQPLSLVQKTKDQKAKDQKTNELPLEVRWLDSFPKHEALTIANIFKTSMEEDLEALTLAESEKKIRSIAHRIKGGCFAVGIEELGKRAGELEITSSSEVNSLREDLKNQMNVEIIRVKAWCKNNG